MKIQKQIKFDFRDILLGNTFSIPDKTQDSTGWHVYNTLYEAHSLRRNMDDIENSLYNNLLDVHIFKNENKNN
jgi:hypothetical protein